MKQHSSKVIMTGLKTIGIVLLLILLSPIASFAEEVPCDKLSSATTSGANSAQNDVNGVKNKLDLLDQNTQENNTNTELAPQKKEKKKRRMVGDDEFGIEF